MRNWMYGVLIATAVVLLAACPMPDGPGGAPLSDEKAITSFGIDALGVTAVVDDGAGTITATVPYLVNLSNLVATFETTGASVAVGSTTQTSGSTANDFTGAVSYVVTAENGTTRTYEATISRSALAAVGNASGAGYLEMSGVYGITTVEIGASVYAIVAGSTDDGVQVIDVTNPSAPAPVSSAAEGFGGFQTLDAPRGVTTVAIGASLYALVAAYQDPGLQIIDITDPSSLGVTAGINDGDLDGLSNPFNQLNGANNVTAVTIGSSVYAIVASGQDDGVQIIGIDDPANPIAIADFADETGGYTELNFAHGVTTVTVGSSTYALVTGGIDNGIEIIDISTPASPIPTATIVDGGADGAGGTFDELGGPYDVATIVIDGSTYAVVASNSDDGVQIIDISDPSTPLATASVTDGVGGFDTLDAAYYVATTTVAGSHYALVTAALDDGVQIIDITDPANPAPYGSASDGVDGFDALDNARGISVFRIGVEIFAVVAGWGDDAVQIIRL